MGSHSQARTMTAAPTNDTQGIRVTQIGHPRSHTDDGPSSGHFRLDSSIDEDSCCQQIKNACSVVRFCTNGFFFAFICLIPSSMITLTVVLLTFTDTSAVLAFLPCTIVLCAPWCVGMVLFTADSGFERGWFYNCHQGEFRIEGTAARWFGRTTWGASLVVLPGSAFAYF